MSFTEHMSAGNSVLDELDYEKAFNHFSEAHALGPTDPRQAPRGPPSHDACRLERASSRPVPNPFRSLGGRPSDLEPREHRDRC